MIRVLDAPEIECTVTETAEPPKLARVGFDSLTLCQVGRSSWVNEIRTSTPHGRSLPTTISAAEADRKAVIDPNLDRAAPLVRLDPGIVAHLGERLTGSQEAAGSTPAGSTVRSYHRRIITARKRSPPYASGEAT